MSRPRLLSVAPRATPGWGRRRGVGGLEGAAGSPRVTEGENLGVRQDPRRSRGFGGLAASVPGTVGKESGSRWRSRIGPREGVPGGRAPALKVEGAQCPVDKEPLNRCAGGEACAHQREVGLPWPPVGRCSSDMDGWSGEESAGVMECRFDEAERGGAGPERFVDPMGRLIDAGGVSQVGIGADCGSSAGR